MQELLHAIYASDLDKVNHLLNNITDIDARLWQDFNALLYSVFRNELAITKLLLESGANVNYQIPFTEYIEHVQIDPETEFVSDEPITEELLEAIQGLGNISALHIAVKNRNYTLCKLLLEFGAQVDMVDQGGCTPLHWAVAQQDEDVVALLLSCKASPNIPDIVGSTPLDEARRRNCANIVYLLTTRLS